MTKSTKKDLLMSDIGLQMQETIDKVKTMKGHKAAKDKLKEMEQSLSMIKQAYFCGVKTAEDIVAGNLELGEEAPEKTKRIADKVINKLRIGWSGDEANFRKERAVDKLHHTAENMAGTFHHNRHCADLQPFDTNESEAHFDL